MVNWLHQRACATALVAVVALAILPARADLAAGLDALAVKDFARARTEFEALPNDPLAIYQVSRMAWHGLGEPSNATRRFGLLQRAAALGHRRSKVEMGWLLGSGSGTNADPPAAIKLLQEADAEGEIEAAVLLGQIYRFAWWDVPQDWPRAAALLKKASDAGNDMGTTHYASMLILGQGVPADPPQASTSCRAFPTRDLSKHSWSSRASSRPASAASRATRPRATPSISGWLARASLLHST